jgi:hypothetical protein
MPNFYQNVGIDPKTMIQNTTSHRIKSSKALYYFFLLIRIMEELLKLGSQKTYKKEDLREISFPIGGIGTGSIGLSGRGLLKDIEIFNRPNMGSWIPRTFPIIRIKTEGEVPIARVLASAPQPPYTPIDGGKFHANGEGFPHMDWDIARISA